jgi:hypothetical protein
MRPSNQEQDEGEGIDIEIFASIRMLQLSTSVGKGL